MNAFYCLIKTSESSNGTKRRRCVACKFCFVLVSFSLVAMGWLRFLTVAFLCNVFFVNRGKGHLIQGNMGIRPTCDVYRGTKTILGYREHKENKFSILGEHGNKPIYFRGTREPPRRASIFAFSLHVVWHGCSFSII